LRITLTRFALRDKCTIGRLYIDGEDTGLYTLEDKVRQIPGEPVEKWKVFGETAIPTGIYNVVVALSSHFKRELPHLQNVPGYEGVLIHPGNTDADTEGCILVGKDWPHSDEILRSREAFDELFARIKAAQGQIQIEIS
jgi:hypothetical protein